MYKVVEYLFEQGKAKETYSEIADTVILNDETEDISSSIPETLSPVIQEDFKLFDVDFNNLISKNKDIVGWIYLPNSPINYPVLQSANNEDYLYTLYNGKHNKAGSIFIDCRTNDFLNNRNTIIYGHNMKNGTMFGILKRYKRQSFYDKNPVIYYITPQNKYEIHLFAGLTTDISSTVFDINTTDTNFEAFMQKIKKSSTFMSSVEYSAGDKVVTLSTCVGNSNSNNRFVVLGILKKYID